MPSFPIDPEIPLRRGAIRSIDEAREFAREMAAGHPGAAWQAMLRMLDRVRTEDDALEAAVAIEGLLEGENLLTAETKVPAARVPLPEPEPASGPAASLVYAAAHAAAPDR
jgi:hypothetical protein